MVSAERIIVRCDPRTDSENIVLKLQLERYVNEAEVLRRRLDTTESCRADASVTPASKDQAKNEIKTMEESVLRELQVLNSLRRVFITDLKNRVQKVSKCAHDWGWSCLLNGWILYAVDSLFVSHEK